jgi:hypothetical protein
MSFWRNASRRIKNHFKRRSYARDTTEAGADEEDPVPLQPPNQTSVWANIPSDILCYICDKAFSETGAYCGVEILALVCKAWYQIVTTYGRPWSIIRIDGSLSKSSIYPTLKGYVKTRLKYSHHYPLDVTIRAIKLGRRRHPGFFSSVMRDAVRDLVGGGFHTLRWGTLDITLHPYILRVLGYPTPILRRAAIEGIGWYLSNIGVLLPMAPNLRSLSLTGMGTAPRLQISVPSYVTLDSLQLEGLSIYTCTSILEGYAKAGRLTTLELTGIRNDTPQTAPITLSTVRNLTLNARAPIGYVFSVIILPALVRLFVVGGGDDGGGANMLSGIESVASNLETLHLESLHFDSKDHIKSILVEAPNVDRLTIKGISYRTSVDLNLGGGLGTMGESSESDYATLLEDPMILPVLKHCMVDDIDREDLVLLRRA